MHLAWKILGDYFDVTGDSMRQIKGKAIAKIKATNCNRIFRSYLATDSQV